ncbi:MAG: tol-pal system-associated acyl-CoA thioesterase [Pseudomonadales bacterium]|nr:tol-pal system-associated acyl-CoA thioesterase [Pseudomonadales bacterium]NRA18421.1 tol-pal system-associated acyl-CoA thioesterase [Oceanospirillaceae bacterium]
MPFRFAVRVYIEDTDIGGIVYYVNYLKFMERARTEFLRAHAVEQQLLQQQGYLFVVKSLSCDYKHSAKLDDQLEITVTIDKIKAASVVFVQSVLHRQKVLCSAVVEVVCVSTATMRPIRFPQQIKQIFANSIDAD